LVIGLVPMSGMGAIIIGIICDPRQVNRMRSPVASIGPKELSLYVGSQINGDASRLHL
jgi:hypothetical protein